MQQVSIYSLALGIHCTLVAIAYYNYRLLCSYRVGGGSEAA